MSSVFLNHTPQLFSETGSPPELSERLAGTKPKESVSTFPMLSLDMHQNTQLFHGCWG